MLSDRAKDALEGIRINVEAIGDFIDGTSLDEFVADRRTIDAVTRPLEIISEASRRVPDDLKARYVEWRAIHDAGNVYRHNDDRVAVPLLWDTARAQLGGLRNAVGKELDADSREREADAGNWTKTQDK